MYCAAQLRAVLDDVSGSPQWACAAASDKPHYLLHTRAGQIDPAHVAVLRAAGIPIVTGIRDGLGAIDRLARWGGWKSNAA